MRKVIVESQSAPQALPGRVALVGLSLGGAGVLLHGAAMQERVSAEALEMARVCGQLKNSDHHLAPLPGSGERDVTDAAGQRSVSDRFAAAYSHSQSAALATLR